MTVTYDTLTNAHHPDSGAFSFLHTPIGTPKGVFLFIMQTLDSNDRVTLTKYGGVTMPRVMFLPKATGEAEALHAYFLGSGIPTGPQNVTFTTDSSLDTDATCVTVTAAGDTVFDVSTSVISDSQSNTSLALNPTAQAMVILGLIWGGTSSFTGVTGPGSVHRFWTQHASSMSYSVATQNVTGAGPTTIGYTHTADDVIAAAFSIREIVDEARLSRESIEAAITEPTTQGLLSRESLEALITGSTTEGRISRLSLETLVLGVPQIRTARESIEVVAAGIPEIRTARESVEVLQSVIDEGPVGGLVKIFPGGTTKPTKIFPGGVIKPVKYFNGTSWELV